MKRFSILVLVLVLAGAAGAQEPAEPAGDFFSGQLTLGGAFTDLDNESSKFQEYALTPEGVTAPAFRLFGRSGGLKYDLRGYANRGNDQRYVLKGESGQVRFTADLLRLPHNFGNDARMLYTETAPGTFAPLRGVSEANFAAIQRAFAARPANVNFTFIDGLLAPQLASATLFDIGLMREQGRFNLDLTRGRPVQVRLAYFIENRAGSRGTAGTAFGFGNVVELPEPVDYRTQDIGANLTYDRSWGSVRASARYNWFENRIPYMTFGNPFRVTDSTHASAYQAPGSASIDGAVNARLALPPDNDAFTTAVGATFKLRRRTRIVADVSWGRWTQNSTAFLPYTTNTAIQGERLVGGTLTRFAATDPSQLPSRQLDGSADVINLSGLFTTRPIDNLTLTARFRRYDLENNTARVEFPGYARFDGVWEDIPRISVPYGYKQERLDTTASYDFGRFTLEGGFKYTAVHRTFREAEKTSEDAFILAANVRPVDRITVRGSYEMAQRDFEAYHAAESEEASFIHEPGETAVPVNFFAFGPAEGGPQPGRYDQARKEFDRVTGLVQVTPIDEISFSLSYLYNRDKYNPDGDSRTANMTVSGVTTQVPYPSYGLTLATYDTLSADLDFSPTDRVNLYAFYARENNKNSQRGRQSGATVSFNAADDWASEVVDKIDTYGGGAGLTLMPDKLFLNVSGQYQKVDGFNDITIFTGGAPFNSRSAFGATADARAGDIQGYDDSKILTFTGELKYNLPRSWAVAVGGLYEKYEFDDSFALAQNYSPSGLFLLGNDRDYEATVGYLRLMYRW